MCDVWMDEVVFTPSPSLSMLVMLRLSWLAESAPRGWKSHSKRLRPAFLMKKVIKIRRRTCLALDCNVTQRLVTGTG